jgi:hypothetical protein
MGDSRSAIADDEDDWYDFKVKTDITQVEWDVYSEQATAARNLHKQYKLKSHRLIDAVACMMSITALAKQQATEDSEYQEYLRLKKKFQGS